MKIGLSLSKCVRDIVLGDVAINEVLVICSRTAVRFDEDPTGEAWEALWLGYKNGGWSRPEWSMLEEEPTKQVVMQLWSEGRIHQPRLYGTNMRYGRDEYHWCETSIPPMQHYENEAVKQAWDHYQMLLSLTQKEEENIDYDF